MLVLLLAGLATGFNIIIIMIKWKVNREMDAILDAFLLLIVAWFTSGTMSGLVIGIVASVMISLYLLVYPPKNVFRKGY